ncbi:MAG TPA: disulfide bond formation protein B [Acidimicrobiales bacterium]
MTTSTLSPFFALLSLACWAATGAIVVVSLLARFRPASAATTWLASVGDLALWFAWVVAAVTTAGSLYYSEVAHFLPCELCWYQRICVYPLSAVLLVAALRRDRDVWRYVAIPAVVGAGIAAYHTQLQAYPSQHTFCSTVNPCTTRYVWEYGFVSLPFMALAAFGFILSMVLVARWTANHPIALAPGAV